MIFKISKSKFKLKTKFQFPVFIIPLSPYNFHEKHEIHIKHDYVHKYT